MWAGTPCPVLILPTHLPGCVRDLRIQGEEIIFHDLNLTVHGISHCPTCRDRPCQVTPHPTYHLAAVASTPSHGWPLWGLWGGLNVLGLISGGCFAEWWSVP